MFIIIIIIISIIIIIIIIIIAIIIIIIHIIHIIFFSTRGALLVRGAGRRQHLSPRDGWTGPEGQTFDPHPHPGGFH